MDAGLGCWIADDTDGLARAFARTRIRLRPLASHRQSAQMPDATITFDCLEPFQIHADLPAQITFNHILAVLNGVDDLRELLLGQILCANARINIRLGEDHFRVARANPVNIPQRNVDALVRRNFYSNNTCHKLKLFSLASVCAGR